jgi:hypothetical protein
MRNPPNRVNAQGAQSITQAYSFDGGRGALSHYQGKMTSESVVSSHCPN